MLPEWSSVGQMLGKLSLDEMRLQPKFSTAIYTQSRSSFLNNRVKSDVYLHRAERIVPN